MASKKHRDKIVRHGSYNILKKNTHLIRKKVKERLKNMANEVQLNPYDMFWKICAKKIQLPPDQSPVGDDPLIQLEWGWTAGMSEEELKNYAEDAPKGKDFVRTTLTLAKELRDQLNEIISKHE